MVKSEFAKIAETAREDAASRREGAAMNGEHSDRGASIIESFVETWEAGLRGEVPDSLKDYVKVDTLKVDTLKDYVKVEK